jgi:tRNA dimethylallyltransferase
MGGLADSQLGIQVGSSAGVWADNLADCPDKPQVIAIVGATATGKSALADALAASLGSELVGADSMQVYRGMDIGTAKTPLSERSVACHCIDLADPGTAFTVARYQREARRVIEELRATNRRPVLCGGSGLYVRAALDGFDLDEQWDEGLAPVGQPAKQPAGQPVSQPAEQPAASLSALLRSRLQAQAEALGPVAFYELLRQRDPESAALIHPHNVRRVVRAFEFLEQGTSYAARHEGFARFEARFPTRFIGLHVEPEVLCEVIDRRVDAMMAAGLLSEVRALLNAGLREALTASQAIGYKELVPVVEGRRPLAEAVAEIKQSTRRYAKRQRTWFRRDPRIQWLDVTAEHRDRLASSASRGNQADFTRLLPERALCLLS